MERPRVIAVDSDGNAAHPPATFARVGLSLEYHQQLLTRARALRRGPVHSAYVKKRKPSSGTMKSRRQSKRVTRKSSEDEGVRVGMDTLPQLKALIWVTPAVSGDLPLEGESAFHVLGVALREHCFVKERFFTKLEGLHQLKRGSAVHQNVKLADPSYKNRSA